MPGCWKPHFAQVILFLQSLLMCPIHKQPKQTHFTLKKHIFSLWVLFSEGTNPICVLLMSSCKLQFVPSLRFQVEFGSPQEP